MKNNNEYYVYLLECIDSNNRHSLYCGYTNNLEKRIEAHRSGKGAKYTRGKTIHLVYFETYPTKSEALSREWYIKHKMSRQEKLELIGENDA